MRTVLVTGGAGYVGSHACKAFAAAGWRVVTFDNLSRGWRDAVKYGPLVVGDIGDGAAVAGALAEHRPDLVAHFAGFGYVGESIDKPDLYYANNTIGTHVLLGEMRKAGVRNIIFSSTCATYGAPAYLPIDEGHPQAPINPYGWSKVFIERMLRDYALAFGLSSVSLRYFNAAGCDPDGEIGERHEPETHVIPLALAAALEGAAPFTINGTDFATRDGTAERDYIHVTDLATAHVLAGEMLLRTPGFHTFNLGTGHGVTVREILDAAAMATGHDIPVRFGPRRPGDPASLVASATKARELLGWEPAHSSIDEIMRTALAWQQAELQRARAKVVA